MTVTPPPTVTFPPQLAEFMVISFNGFVVTVGEVTVLLISLTQRTAKPDLGELFVLFNPL